MKTLWAVVLFFFLVGAVAWGGDSTLEQSFRNNFPDVSFEALKPTVIKGLYEVVTERGIIYYASEAECLVAGDIITKQGINITQQRRREILLARVKAIPLDKALKVGSGRHTVIEFTDPNCAYCRRAFQAMEKIGDMTRYVFFYPLSEASADKVKHILCADDRIGAYKDAFSGELDNKYLDPCEKEEVKTMMEFHREQGKKLGLEGTPFFIIDGKIVAGADIPLIEKLLTTPLGK